MWRSNGKHFWFIFGKFPVQISARRPAILSGVFPGFSPVTVSKCGVNTLNYTTTFSFQILYNSVIAIPFDPMYYEFLTAPLNEPLINNQIDADGRIILKSVWGRCVVNLWAEGGWRRIRPVVRQCDCSSEILVIRMKALLGPLQFPLWDIRVWLWSYAPASSLNYSSRGTRL
jgi:hypothetical protein